jgi:hypothetical protein
VTGGSNALARAVSKSTYNLHQSPAGLIDSGGQSLQLFDGQQCPGVAAVLVSLILVTFTRTSSGPLATCSQVKVFGHSALNW